MSTPAYPSLNVIHDIAVRKFDAADKTFDSLNARAAAMIGWTSIILAASALVYQRLGHATVFAVVIVVLAAAAIGCACWAYGLADVPTWPNAEKHFELHAHLPESQTRLLIMSRLVGDEKRLRVVVRKKAHILTWGYRAMAASALWIMVQFATLLWRG